MIVYFGLQSHPKLHFDTATQRDIIYLKVNQLHHTPVEKMSAKLPYTYISCSCTDNTRSAINTSSRSSGRSASTQAAATKLEDEEKTFDPKAPRSAYSLWPIERLLFCDDCHQIRCPRCVQEEVMIWYCPSCLFEVPLFTVKSEGNR